MLIAQQQQQIQQLQRQQQQLQQQQQQPQQPQAYAYASAPGAPAAGYAQPSASASSGATANEGKQLLVKAYSLGDGEDLSTMQALRAQMEEVYLECQRAMGAYKKSIELQNRAGGSNVVSMLARNEMVERTMQLKRDKEMEAALVPAEKASESLIVAFKAIPQAVRVMYPEEMQDVGNIPVASLSVGKFGRDVIQGAVFGEFGDTMNQLSHARKIKENERKIEGCMAITHQQMELIAVVIKKMDKKIAELKAGPSTVAYSAPSAAPSATAYAAPSIATTSGYAAAPSASAYAPPPSRAAPPQTTTVATGSLLPGYDDYSYAPPPAVMAPPPAAIPSVRYVELTADHIVDEYSEVMLKHGIIRVVKGERVILLRGNLETGLGAPYQDYIEVQRLSDNKVGKISRKVVRLL